MPYMIAVTGGSGSGKSTLAGALQHRLGEDRAVLLTEDAYYRPRAEQAPGAASWSPAECEARINFDDPRAKEMDRFRLDLEALRAGQAILQPVYDFASHDRLPGAIDRREPRAVAIVEGVHVLSDPGFAQLFDLTVFVDTPDDIRLARRIRRDVAERGRALERVLAQYFAFVRVAHRRFTEPAKLLCDLVIADEGPLAYEADAPSAASVDRLVAPVWAKLSLDGIV